MPFEGSWSSASLSWFSLTLTRRREAKGESGDLLANDSETRPIFKFPTRVFTQVTQSET